MKTCTRCRQRLPLAQFSKKAGGLQPKCKACCAERQHEIRYGLSIDEYNRFLEKQGGFCAICRGPEPRYARLVVDHDHVTGAVRGLLCSNCNPMIGYAGDSPIVLRDAARYLEEKP